MPHILVVEDEAPNAEILTRLLMRYDFEVSVAQSKVEALDSMAISPADLVLMDVRIPDAPGGPENDSGGLEATQELKANPKTSQVPIIATSASALLDEQRRFLDAGCDAVQCKPYDFSELMNCIRNLLAT